MKRVRERMKSTVYGSLLWRIFIGAIGGLITVAGMVMLFAPGPGLLVLLAGLGMLATEFAWAATALRRTKDIAAVATNRVRVPLWVKYLIAALATIVSIILIAHRFA
ncbi:MAG: hypothetical protein EB054_00365 [Actinobacteria bacterium]|nr:hypothetical protein [Actinomycetota bacterium]